ncbi:hypothetical protein DFH09DRAFT_1366850 [Mycena vulgaris]|nr:hypothetical protein DFH09DRAFT_1366850 [Mycena vulgaris]
MVNSKNADSIVDSLAPVLVPVPASASGRSHRDTQPFPAIGTAFLPIVSIARLDSDRRRTHALRPQPGILNPFPTAPARAHGIVAAGVDAHPIIDTGAHRVAEADTQIPRDGRGLRADPHPSVAATEEHEIGLAADSNAQRDSTFAYNPQVHVAAE